MGKAEGQTGDRLKGEGEGMHAILVKFLPGPWMNQSHLNEKEREREAS